MTDFDNTDSYREKLRESLVIASSLLDVHAKIFNDTQAYNEKLQTILLQASANAQAGLALFEAVQNSIADEHRSGFLELASAQANTAQQLFEVLKDYKGVEEEIQNSIISITPQIMDLAKS